VKDAPRIPSKTVRQALAGKGGHIDVRNIFDGLDFQLAGKRPKRAAHSVFQLLNHLNFWQDWVVEWLQGNKPKVPEHAAGGWPGSAGPASQQEWEESVQRFCTTLNKLCRLARPSDLLSKQGKTTRLEMLHNIASHNSYHAGQVVLVRQMLGAWPPPSGGVTW